jgi:hypothetical protein
MNALGNQPRINKIEMISIKGKPLKIIIHIVVLDQGIWLTFDSNHLLADRD